MKLKNSIDYTEFLQQVRRCQGEVYYETAGGDMLNLKSVLSEYLFISAAMTSDLLCGGRVICSISSDYLSLCDYIERAL